MRARVPAAAVAVAMTLCLDGCHPGHHADPSQPTSSSTAAPSCPFRGGQSCLGVLTAGTYSTSAFTPALTYTVPAGWANAQDTAGNFLLLPPDQSLKGVNDATSDYIGVYSSVVPDSSCDSKHPAPLPPSPSAYAAWFQQQPALKVSDRHEVSVGGLAGISLDVELDPAWRHHCAWADALMLPYLDGVDPTVLELSIAPGPVSRLYLLASSYFGAPRVLEVEVVDVAGAADLVEYSSVVSRFRFGPPL